MNDLPNTSGASQLLKDLGEALRPLAADAAKVAVIIAARHLCRWLELQLNPSCALDAGDFTD